jgi:hypothetical protein
MSKLEELISSYQDDAKKLNLTVVYNADSSKVASSDQTELDRIKKNFLIGKLGLADSTKLDEAIQEVVNTFGSSSRNKHRALFYYLLVKKFGKESVYN